jgi:hypothetical protein
MRYKYSQQRMIDNYRLLFDQQTTRGVGQRQSSALAASTDKA